APVRLRKTTLDKSVYDADNTQIMSNKADQLELVQFTDPDTGREETENTVLQPALDEINADLAESCTGFAAKEQEARGLKKDMGENYVVYTNEDTLQVVRADDKVLSVVRDDYTNTGGAHGYSAETAYSYDAASGKRLTLADMLKNTDIRNLTGILKTEVVKQAAEGQADGLFTEGLEDTIAGMLKATDGMTGDVQSTSSDMTYGPLTWYAGQDGLHFVFNAYDIGAYAAGRFLVTLTPEAYPDLVNDAWFGEETASIEPIDQFTEYQVDGKKLYISVDWSSDTQTIKSLGVQYGDANKTFDCYSYGNEYYLADTGNGKVLLVNTTQDNDLETLEVIPLTQGDLKMTSGDFGMYSNIPIDPDNLILAGRTTVMSTMTAERPYRLAADGTLDPLDKWYLIQMEEPLTFTLKQDAELPVLKAMDSDETQNVTFPKGTKMTPLRTDNEKTLDCRTSDGRIIRFTVDTAEFPQIVNGTYKLEDLLDGTVFAG
ncbi:MAG: DUF4163 domain-containing protein, partial [Lachnospiraceae bacterium]|nr:DUF4163 domain-containing protein [Lachnospiraceae bacterium]